MAEDPQAPPQYSADGRFWWDGRGWTPVPVAPPPPAPPAAPTEPTTATSPQRLLPTEDPDRSRSGDTTFWPQPNGMMMNGKWRGSPARALALYVTLAAVSAVLESINDQISGYPYRFWDVVGAVVLYVAVLAAVVWRVWKRGRFTYWIILPLIVVLAAAISIWAQVDPELWDYERRPNLGLAALSWAVSVYALRVMYSHVVRNHVGPLRRRG